MPGRNRPANTCNTDTTTTTCTAASPTPLEERTGRTSIGRENTSLWCGGMYLSERLYVVCLAQICRASRRKPRGEGVTRPEDSVAVRLRRMVCQLPSVPPLLRSQLNTRQARHAASNAQRCKFGPAYALPFHRWLERQALFVFSDFKTRLRHRLQSRLRTNTQTCYPCCRLTASHQHVTIVTIIITTVMLPSFVTSTHVRNVVSIFNVRVTKLLRTQKHKLGKTKTS